MMNNRQKRLIIRISKGRLSFATADGSDVLYEDYALNSSISMAANLREALPGVKIVKAFDERFPSADIPDVIKVAFLLWQLECLAN